MSGVRSCRVQRDDDTRAEVVGVTGAIPHCASRRPENKTEKRRPHGDQGGDGGQRLGRSMRSAGQSVHEGDELMILESMKMEVPVVSPAEGIVHQILVKPDDVVQPGDLLAVVD